MFVFFLFCFFLFFVFLFVCFFVVFFSIRRFLILLYSETKKKSEYKICPFNNKSHCTYLYLCLFCMIMSVFALWIFWNKSF